MLPLQILQNILFFVFVWIIGFLFHELMHIKGQGIKSTGVIFVYKAGFRANVDKLKYEDWFYYSGGLLCFPVMLFLSMFLSGWYQWCFLCQAVVQLVYGFFEGAVHVSKNRFPLYVCVVVCMLVVWFIFY